MLFYLTKWTFRKLLRSGNLSGRICKVGDLSHIASVHLINRGRMRLHALHMSCCRKKKEKRKKLKVMLISLSLHLQCNLNFSNNFSWTICTNFYFTNNIVWTTCVVNWQWTIVLIYFFNSMVKCWYLAFICFIMQIAPNHWHYLVLASWSANCKYNQSWPLQPFFSFFINWLLNN